MSFLFLGNRQIGRDSGAIKLDALTQTVDPDNSNQDLSCNWKCEDQDGGFCYSFVNKGQLIFASVSGCETEVQSNHFTAGKTYKIRLVCEQKQTVMCLDMNIFETYFVLRLKYSM